MAASWSGSDDGVYPVPEAERSYQHDLIDINTLRETAAALAKRGTRRRMSRVPQLMYQVNPSAYTPQFVSIGPYHRHNASSSHGNADLQAMEGHKQVFMLRLLERTEDPNTAFQECKNVADGVVGVLVDDYYTEMDISSELLSRIILVDACFLLEVFLKHSGVTNSRVNCSIEEVMLDNEYRNVFTSAGLRRDLALLENQLPFFVLERLFKVIRDNIAPPTNIQSFSLPKIAFALFKSDLNCHHKLFRLGTADEHPQYRHLLDLISNYARPSSSSRYSNLPPVSQLSPIVHLRNAKRLSEVGIHFERAGESMLLDIEFCNGVFRIPPLVINNCTESLLRNLMAFEHSSCNPDDPADLNEYFASYVFLMERLVMYWKAKES